MSLLFQYVLSTRESDIRTDVTSLSHLVLPPPFLQHAQAESRVQGGKQIIFKHAFI